MELTDSVHNNFAMKAASDNKLGYIVRSDYIYIYIYIHRRKPQGSRCWKRSIIVFCNHFIYQYVHL